MYSHLVHTKNNMKGAARIVGKTKETVAHARAAQTKTYKIHDNTSRASFCFENVPAQAPTAVAQELRKRFTQAIIMSIKIFKHG